MKKSYLKSFLSSVLVAALAFSASAEDVVKNVTVRVLDNANKEEIAQPFKSKLTISNDGETTKYELTNIFDGEGVLKFKPDTKYGNDPDYDVYDIKVIDPAYEQGAIVYLGTPDGEAFLEVSPKPVSEGSIPEFMTYLCVVGADSRIYTNHPEKGNSISIRCAGYYSGWTYMYFNIDLDEAEEDTATYVHVFDASNKEEIAKPFASELVLDEESDHHYYTLKNLFGSGADVKFRTDANYSKDADYDTYDIVVFDPIEVAGALSALKNAEGNDYLTVNTEPLSEGSIPEVLDYFSVVGNDSRVYYNHPEKGNSVDLRCAGYNGGWKYMHLHVDLQNASISVVEIDNDNSEYPVEYYNIQGIRVNGENLKPGLYIRRQGKSAEKILIR